MALFGYSTFNRRPPAGPWRAISLARRSKSAAKRKNTLPEPNAEQIQAFEVARDRVRSRGPRLSTTFESRSDGNIGHIGPPHSDQQGWYARLQDVFGTNGSDFPIAQLNHILSFSRDSSGSYDQVKTNALVAAVEAVRAEDEVQGMLAVQMAVTHELAMQVLRRAARAEQIPQFDSAANMAVKLMRTYTMQAEALAKLKRGGEQVVKVVHVHPGAQAVVGNVVHARAETGGGDTHGSCHQPHAKEELPASSPEIMPAVRREDEERERLPVTRRTG